MKETIQSFFDFHLHTNKSPDAISTPSQVVKAAKEKGLSGFIVSDHDTTSAYNDIDELAKEQGLIAIPGAEITCIKKVGKYISVPHIKPLSFKLTVAHIPHLIAVGIPTDKNLPSFRAPDTVANWIHNEGGIVIAAHPKKNGGVTSLSQTEIFDLREHLDGLEVANPGGLHTDVVQWADELQLAKIGGSDSHSPSSVGTITTGFPQKFEKWSEVVTAIQVKEAAPIISPDFVHRADKTKKRDKLWTLLAENVL